MCHLHLKLCTPPCGTVFYTLPELLGILGFVIHYKPECYATCHTNQQIFWVEVRQRIGKQLVKTAHNCHHLIRSIRTFRHSPQPCHLVTEIAGKDIWKIQKHQLFGIHTSGFCFQILGDCFQILGYSFNDVTQRLCPLSLFFSRLRSLFLFCDTTSFKRFSFSLTEVLPFRFSLP